MIEPTQEHAQDDILTNLAIIEETVEYYTADPNRRATIHGECRYLTSDGRMCAVGRCLLNPGKVPRQTGGVTITWNCGKSMDKDLKPQYRFRDKVFWNALQRLHDDPQYWTTEGLSGRGTEYVAELKERFG